MSPSIWIRNCLTIAIGAASGPVFAQALVITPDESVLVERYIVEEPALPPPFVIEENITLRPGSQLPVAVPLRPFGGNSALAKFSYFVSVDDKVVVVDPASRTVVRIFNAKR